MSSSWCSLSNALPIPHLSWWRDTPLNGYSSPFNINPFSGCISKVRHPNLALTLSKTSSSYFKQTSAVYRYGSFLPCHKCTFSISKDATVSDAGVSFSATTFPSASFNVYTNFWFSFTFLTNTSTSTLASFPTTSGVTFIPGVP